MSSEKRYKTLLIVLALSYLIAWACFSLFLDPKDVASLGVSPPVQKKGGGIDYAVLGLVVLGALSFTTPVVAYRYANLLDRDDWFGLLVPLLIVIVSFFFPPACLIMLFINSGRSPGVSVEASTADVGGITEATVDRPRALEYPEIGELSTAVRQAMAARDQAARDEWARRGRPGAGQLHRCKICGKTTYGEESVLDMQKQALYVQHNPLEAQRIDQMSAYRCQSCGNEYCKDCLEKKAPSNSSGGKSCPACYGLFEIIHG